MTPSVARAYVRAMKLIKKYRYSDKDCEIILTTMSWSTFSLALDYSQKKIPVAGFIKKYKDIRKATKKVRSGSTCERLYHFPLPKKEAAVLDTYLLNCGMEINGKKRVGLRAAMIKLINNKLK